MMKPTDCGRCGNDDALRETAIVSKSVASVVRLNARVIMKPRLQVSGARTRAVRRLSSAPRGRHDVGDSVFADKPDRYQALTIAIGLRSGMRNQKVMHGPSEFRPPPYAARAKVSRTVNDDDLKVGSDNLKSVYTFLGHVGSAHDGEQRHGQPIDLFGSDQCRNLEAARRCRQRDRVVAGE